MFANPNSLKIKMKDIGNLKLLGVIIILAASVQACKNYGFRANYQEANKLLHATENIRTKPYLKAHMKNGDVCILKDTWIIDTNKNTVFGNGKRFDYNRKEIFLGEMTLHIDSVSIFETNSKILKPEKGRIATLSILTGIDVALGVICITNPKVCFGSCPTFYMNEDNNFHFADSEGFSNAIAPSMEYSDIDALNNPPIEDQIFSLTMKNEALETHCVNDVKLLAYPRKKGERIFQSKSNEFYLCQNDYLLSHAEGQEGIVTALLKNEDRQERFSLADEKNLSSKEEIYLTFDGVENQNDLGLIVNFRQTLMTTYFIYSAIGFMGDQVGDFFAKIEQSKEINSSLKNGITKELGNIDLYALNSRTNEWELQDGLYETGPIAVNRQIIPLKIYGKNQQIKLKLVMNKGLWRIDFTALTNIKGKVKPLEIKPSSIYNKGQNDLDALSAIENPNKHLISMPGNEYRFHFELPEKNMDYELFLYSKGYYLEWMREHWLKDKNLLKLHEMVYNPKKYLRNETKDYKEYESMMEQEFWNSKIDTKTFIYYEKN